jgi:hypothetical protein
MKAAGQCKSIVGALLDEGGGAVQINRRGITWMKAAGQCKSIVGALPG